MICSRELVRQTPVRRAPEGARRIFVRYIDKTKRSIYSTIIDNNIPFFWIVSLYNESALITI